MNWNNGTKRWLLQQKKNGNKLAETFFCSSNFKPAAATTACISTLKEIELRGIERYIEWESN